MRCQCRCVLRETISFVEQSFCEVTMKTRKMLHPVLLLLLIMITPVAKCAVPGTFFWKPRLSLDLAIPTTETSMSIRQPTYSNMHDGLVVLIDGYQAGLTVIALAECLSSRSIYPHLNPTSAYFYTNVYRWALRYFSLIPHWLSGHGGNIVETHRTWRRRFYYMEEFMPKWMRHLFPYVEKSEWDREEHEMKKFKKYAEAAFGKHYRFPNKEFNNWLSQLTFETAENLDSDNSIAVNAFKVHE